MKTSKLKRMAMSNIIGFYNHESYATPIKVTLSEQFGGKGWYDVEHGNGYKSHIVISRLLSDLEWGYAAEISEDEYLLSGIK